MQMILNLHMGQAPVRAVAAALRAALVPNVTHPNLTVSTTSVLTMQQALLQHMLLPGSFKVSLSHFNIQQAYVKNAGIGCLSCVCACVCMCVIDL